MLNRRYLRIKVMQVLYSFFQSDEQDMVRGERELLKNIDKIYDLTIYVLLLIVEIRDQADLLLEGGKNKMLPTSKELNPSRRFLDNKLIKQISESTKLSREASNRKITWQTEAELARKIFNTIKASPEYSKYMEVSEDSYQLDRDFIVDVFKKYISEFDLLIHFFEEKSIYWIDDLRLVNSSIVKTFESLTENSAENLVLSNLYKDEEDDRAFILELFRKTIQKNEENEKLITEKTKNWELERIAMMDVLLMKMAITEMVTFSNIPVKVSLNEYIELSKLYSSPKSKMFINGILDKLVIDLKEQKKLVKTGRGLVE